MGKTKRTAPPAGKEGRKERFLRSLREGATWREASQSAGVCERTTLRWSKEDPAFAEAVDRVREARIAEVEDLTYRLCLDPDSKYNTLRVFFLKSRAGWDEDDADRAAEAPSAEVDPKVAEVAISAALGAAKAKGRPRPSQAAGGDEPRRRPQHEARKR